MDEDWRESDGRNVFQMIHDAGGVGIWVRRTTWDGTVARIVGMSAPNGPPPYFGSPKVVMDVFGLDGSQRDQLAHLSTAGTYKTWRQVDPPAWTAQAKLRHLDDPKIAAALHALTKKRSVMAESSLELNVPYDRQPVEGRRAASARRTLALVEGGHGCGQFCGMCLAGSLTMVGTWLRFLNKAPTGDILGTAVLQAVPADTI